MPSKITDTPSYHQLQAAEVAHAAAVKAGGPNSPAAREALRTRIAAISQCCKEAGVPDVTKGEH